MNKPLLLPLAMLLGLALAHGPALAMPGTGKSSAESFQKMDADKDGKVTKEEFAKAHPGMKESTFGVLDKDNNGCLTQEEWDSFMQGHGAMKAQPGGAAPGAWPVKPGAMPMVTPPAGK